MDDLLTESMSPRDRLILLNNAVIIRVARGDSGAEGIAEMERLGEDMSGGWHQFVADPEANRALAAGDLEKAHASFMEVASDDSQAPEYLYRAARPALWNRDLAEARTLLTKLDQTGAHGPAAEARRATVAAGIAALEGRAAESLALYRDAQRGWRAMKAVWDEALTGVDMATLLDPAEPEVAAVIASTREILERLGAKPYLERLDAAVSAGAPRQAAPEPVRISTRAEVAVSD